MVANMLTELPRKMVVRGWPTVWAWVYAALGILGAMEVCRLLADMGQQHHLFQNVVQKNGKFFGNKELEFQLLSEAFLKQEAVSFSANKEELQPLFEAGVNQQSIPFSASTIDCALAGFPGKSIPRDQQYHPMNNFSDTILSNSTSCRSKYLQHCFFKDKRQEPPSTRFLAALREYETLHNRCVHFHNLTDLFLAGKAPEGCQYMIWRNKDGMGNQLISLVSAFVYSLLTHRTLLIARDQSGLHDLFCEPFPSSSWKLPDNFPYDTYPEHYDKFFLRVVNFTKGPKGEASLEALINRPDPFEMPSHLFVYLTQDSTEEERQFFCPTEQRILTHVPWMLFKSNQFSVPGLYTVPEFGEELRKLFPDRKIFLHAGRYLLSPANDVWRRITSFYDANLDTADKKLGIQVRIFTGPEYMPINSQHLLQYTIASNLLPNFTTDSVENEDSRSNTFSDPERNITVLITTLDARYHHDMKEHFLQHPNYRGNQHNTVVTPSSEGWQDTGDRVHDKKAIADMWLLSFMDDVVSSPRSTFGYVAHGLAGITPILLMNWCQSEEKLPPSEQLCERNIYTTVKSGPCFMDPPWESACPLGEPGLRVEEVPEVRQCEHQQGVGISESDVDPGDLS